MMCKNNVSFEDSSIRKSLQRLINLTYKLLPIREEGEDWRRPLETIIEELNGMNRVLIGQHDILFPLICKLEGMFGLDEEEDFALYRRVIFECLNLMNELKLICH